MDKDPVRKFLNEDVNYGRIIGKGSFGIVFEGTLKGEKIAIKIPKDELVADVLNELKFLAKLKHPNVVHFYGVLAEDCGVNLIFEFLNGDVRTFVRNPEITPETLLGISHDISMGMDYIHELNIIHRDLAARNVLLDSKNTAKISDFGLSRLVDRDAEYIYSIKPTSILPIRWMPRESLPTDGDKGRFNKSSDIWSFGVTIWEVWNRAEVPYANLNDEEVKNALGAGQNPMSFEIPDGIPEGIKRLLEHIFVEEELRPSFANIKILLNNIRKGNGDLNAEIWRDFQKNQSQNQIEGQCSNWEENAAFLTAKSINFPEEGASGPSAMNLAQIEINDAEFKLTSDNIDILSSLKDNYTVNYLHCTDISSIKIPEIAAKFKAAQTLIFWHNGNPSGKCTYFNSSPGGGTEDCIFKLPQLNTLENLKQLTIQNLDINTGDVNIGPVNLPNLKILIFYFCNIRGNFVDTIATRLHALEDIRLWANVPLLEKTDVETLLRIKSLKFIHLNKWGDRQVINGSFNPFGPDGNLFGQITQNSLIEFNRDYNTLPWNMTMSTSNH